MGDYNPAAHDTREMDLTPFWTWFCTLDQPLMDYAVHRYLGMLDGSDPLTFQETAHAMGVSRRTVATRAREFKALALDTLADAFT